MNELNTRIITIVKYCMTYRLSRSEYIQDQVKDITPTQRHCMGWFVCLIDTHTFVGWFVLLLGPHSAPFIVDGHK